LQNHTTLTTLLQRLLISRADRLESITTARITLRQKAMLSVARGIDPSQMHETAFANEHPRQAVMDNTIENFEPVFNKHLENLFVERMNGNEEIFIRLMNNKAFRNIAAGCLMIAIYQQVNNQFACNTSILGG
jgi:hypothetical protein